MSREREATDIILSTSNFCRDAVLTFDLCFCVGLILLGDTCL
jgi:hypothetical protein